MVMRRVAVLPRAEVRQRAVALRRVVEGSQRAVPPRAAVVVPEAAEPQVVGAQAAVLRAVDRPRAALIRVAPIPVAPTPAALGRAETEPVAGFRWRSIPARVARRVPPRSRYKMAKSATRTVTMVRRLFL